jgi:ABC-type enterochelin transport system permease subunit
MDTTQTVEEKWEHRLRLFLALIVMLIGAAIIIDSIFLSKNYNGFQIIVGLEMLGGSYFIILKKFSGFKVK